MSSAAVVIRILRIKTSQLQSQPDNEDLTRKASFKRVADDILKRDNKA